VREQLNIHTMVLTVITNSCGSEVTFTEGNAGVYRVLKVIPDKGSYTIKVDLNATYREYIFRLDDNDEQVIISSDDTIEYAAIEFLRSEDGVFSWEGRAREMEPNIQPGNPPRLLTQYIFNRGAWAGFFKLLWNGNSSLR